MSEKKFTCEICKGAMHKYKCPKCLMKYCSVSCFKTHKENGCIPKKMKEDATENVFSGSPDYNTGKQEESCEEDLFDTEDRVPAGVLAKLGRSEELKMLLRNPNLTNLISQVDQAQKPDTAIAQAMQDPVFSEFVDKCLAIVEPGNNVMESVNLQISDSDSN